VIITIAVYAVAHVVLTRTIFGRATYAIGGNEEAARLSGVAGALPQDQGHLRVSGFDAGSRRSSSPPG
jgi:ABC-type uncharacterized transport system permease subunit